jgi:hypothetical protein
MTASPEQGFLSILWLILYSGYNLQPRQPTTIYLEIQMAAFQHVHIHQVLDIIVTEFDFESSVNTF